jgi:hypothetical protein
LGKAEVTAVNIGGKLDWCHWHIYTDIAAQGGIPWV